MNNRMIKGVFFLEFLFTSERLGYRLLTLEDVEACEQFWGREEVMTYCGGSTDSALLPQVIDFYQQCQADFALSVYGVVDLATNQVIGAAGFNIEDSLDEVELIFHFTKDNWNKGYATEAAIACMKFAEEQGSVQKVIASASIENKASLNILGKIGFQYMGIKYFEDLEQEEAYFGFVF